MSKLYISEFQFDLLNNENLGVETVETFDGFFVELTPLGVIEAKKRGFSPSSLSVHEPKPQPHPIGDCQCGQGGCFAFTDGSTSCGMQLE